MGKALRALRAPCHTRAMDHTLELILYFGLVLPAAIAWYLRFVYLCYKGAFDS